MNRIPDARWGAPIGEALRVARRFTHRLGHVRFVCGIDPVFAGIHAYQVTAAGIGYDEVAHCCYPWHLVGPADRRTTTIVLPRPVGPSVIVHELGHALHETIGFSHSPDPVTDYAKTNGYEAFAEAFRAWHYVYGDQDVANSDARTLALLKELQA